MPSYSAIVTMVINGKNGKPVAFTDKTVTFSVGGGQHSQQYLREVALRSAQTHIRGIMEDGGFFAKTPWSGREADRPHMVAIPGRAIHSIDVKVAAIFDDEGFSK